MTSWLGNSVSFTNLQSCVLLNESISVSGVPAAVVTLTPGSQMMGFGGTSPSVSIQPQTPFIAVNQSGWVVDGTHNTMTISSDVQGITRLILTGQALDKN